MTFQEVLKRALEVRAKYSELEKNKYGKEWTREQIMQGFVGDVGDLMKLTMAKQGVRAIEDADEKIAHELADCLWSVLVLSEKYGVDLEQAFIKTMESLDRRITEGHG